MSLAIGTTLGPYTVTAKIGEGGMGEVYRARDTNLDRDVAIKVLPEAFTSDPDRLARFEREAKVLASLNHPNIGAIYGLEKSGDTRALVLELIEGPTLAERIKQGPIPVDEALPIAKQIAEALEAAHEQGIIHRDLKPANVKVKHDGTVKVLDFGLAKALDTAPEGDPSQSPTLTAAATQMGVIMGTAAYMSPEQARGKPVDRRTDVWAFGAVLYEMLTGRRAFEGEDVSLTLAEVMKGEPVLESLPADTTPALRSALTRCLMKDPSQRVRDIGDVRLAMEGAFETVAGPATDPAPAAQLRVWQRPVPAASLALALLLVGGLSAWAVARSTPRSSRVERFVLQPPVAERVALSNGRRDIAISPDGSTVVFSATGGNPYQLYARPLEALTGTAIAGLDAPAYDPFFSPDGAWVGFVSYAGEDTTDASLHRVSVLGGPPLMICRIDSLTNGADWGPDNTIIFATNRPSGLWRVSVDGGEPEELTAPDVEQGVNHTWPHILPGGRAVLFTSHTGSDFEDAQIAVLDLDSGDERVLFPGGSGARYAPSGHIVYGVNGTLRAVGFDLERLEVTNPNPVPVLDDVSTKAGDAQNFGAVNFDIADDGSLVYLPGTNTNPLQQGQQLVWVNREGGEDLLPLPPRDYQALSLSPNGEEAALQIVVENNTGVWVGDLERGALRLIADGPAFDGVPLWSPDGGRIAFTSNRAGFAEVLWKAADGSGDAEVLTSFDGEVQQAWPYDWSPGGDGLLVVVDAGTSLDIATVELDGSGTWEPLIHTDADERGPAMAPNGQWIAYESNETGGPQVYLQRYPELGDKRLVSVTGGMHPIWSSDSRELFYARRVAGALPDAMMRVAVDLGDPGRAPMVSRPEALFDYRYGASPNLRTYGLSRNGDRFLMSGGRVLEDDTFGQIILVQNWFEELKRLVPIN